VAQSQKQVDTEFNMENQMKPPIKYPLPWCRHVVGGDAPKKVVHLRSVTIVDAKGNEVCAIPRDCTDREAIADYIVMAANACGQMVPELELVRSVK
jgi:hypothetical protein